jgi:hypothetical protein
VIILTGCVQLPKVEGYSSPSIQAMQQRVPFTIIVTKYLPKDIRMSQPSSLQSYDVTGMNILLIGIMYESGDINKYVLIEETSKLYIVHHSEVDNFSILTE